MLSGVEQTASRCCWCSRCYSEHSQGGESRAQLTSGGTQGTDDHTRRRSYTALFPRFIAIVSGSSALCESATHYHAKIPCLLLQITTRISRPYFTPCSLSLEVSATSHRVRYPLSYWPPTPNSMRRVATAFPGMVF